MASSEHISQTVSQDPTAHGLAIIATNSYEGIAPLNGSEIDADKMKTAFEMLKFAIHLAPNSTKDQMEKLAADAGRCEYPPSYKCIVFYFSGHGHNQNLSSEDRLHTNFIMSNDWKAVSTGVIIQSFYPKNLGIKKLFFLDACRVKDPEAIMIDPGVGTVKYPTEGNFLVAYSTIPEAEAYEVEGGSIWTAALAKLLPTSNKTVEGILSDVRERVRFQVPETVSRLIGSLNLREIAGLDPGQPGPDPSILDQKPQTNDFTYWEHPTTKESFMIINTIQGKWTKVLKVLRLPPAYEATLKATPTTTPASNCSAAFDKWLRAGKDEYLTPKTWKSVLKVMKIIGEGEFGETIKSILTTGKKP